MSDLQRTIGSLSAWYREAASRLALPVVATLLVSTTASALGSPTLQPLRYCVPSATVDLYPFRKFESGYDMAYLTALTRSYISTDPDEPAMLSKWQFSPDGHVFRGEVSPTATWTDGTPLSSREAALGIAKGFQQRPIGERVHVPGDEALRRAGWKEASVGGIKLIDGHIFEITFESKIKNLSGTVRDALSTNSRQNRVWPARLSLIDGDRYGSQFDLVSKQPLANQASKDDVGIKVGSTTVSIVPVSKCNTPGDFYLYSNEISNDLGSFTASLNNGEQVIYALINGANPELKTKMSRQALAAWLIQSYANPREGAAFHPIYSHFKSGEPGSGQGTVDWSSYLSSSASLPIKKIRWVANNGLDERHPVRKLLSAQAAKTGVRQSFSRIKTGSVTSDAHLLIESSRVESGRQIWMQDAYADNFYHQFLAAFPATTAALKTIAENSAATVPVDNKTLSAFDQASSDEVSIIPLGRIHVPLYSRKTSPIEAVFTKNDEISFRPRKVAQ